MEPVAGPSGSGDRMSPKPGPSRAFYQEQGRVSPRPGPSRAVYEEQGRESPRPGPSRAFYEEQGNVSPRPGPSRDFYVQQNTPEEPTPGPSRVFYGGGEAQQIIMDPAPPPPSNRPCMTHPVEVPEHYLTPEEQLRPHRVESGIDIVNLFKILNTLQNRIALACCQHQYMIDPLNNPCPPDDGGYKPLTAEAAVRDLRVLSKQQRNLLEKLRRWNCINEGKCYDLVMNNVYTGICETCLPFAATRQRMKLAARHLRKVRKWKAERQMAKKSSKTQTSTVKKQKSEGKVKMSAPALPPRPLPGPPVQIPKRKRKTSMAQAEPPHPETFFTQENFLAQLGLVTPEVYLQRKAESRRTERRRRTTANPKYRSVSVAEAAQTGRGKNLRSRGQPEVAEEKTVSVLSSRNAYAERRRAQQRRYECTICAKKDVKVECDTCLSGFHPECLRVTGSKAPTPTTVSVCPNCVESRSGVSPSECILFARRMCRPSIMAKNAEPPSPGSGNASIKKGGGRKKGGRGKAARKRRKPPQPKAKPATPPKPKKPSFKNPPSPKIRNPSPRIRSRSATAAALEGTLNRSSAVAAADAVPAYYSSASGPAGKRKCAQNSQVEKAVAKVPKTYPSKAKLKATSSPTPPPPGKQERPERKRAYLSRDEHKFEKQSSPIPAKKISTVVSTETFSADKTPTDSSTETFLAKKISTVSSTQAFSVKKTPTGSTAQSVCAKKIPMGYSTQSHSTKKTPMMSSSQSISTKKIPTVSSTQSLFIKKVPMVSFTQSFSTNNTLNQLVKSKLQPVYARKSAPPLLLPAKAEDRKVEKVEENTENLITENCKSVVKGQGKALGIKKATGTKAAPIDPVCVKRTMMAFSAAAGIVLSTNGMRGNTSSGSDTKPASSSGGALSQSPSPTSKITSTITSEGPNTKPLPIVVAGEQSKKTCASNKPIVTKALGATTSQASTLKSYPAAVVTPTHSKGLVRTMNVLGRPNPANNAMTSNPAPTLAIPGPSATPSLCKPQKFGGKATSSKLIVTATALFSGQNNILKKSPKTLEKKLTPAKKKSFQKMNPAALKRVEDTIEKVVRNGVDADATPRKESKTLTYSSTTETLLSTARKLDITTPSIPGKKITWENYSAVFSTSSHFTSTLHSEKATMEMNRCSSPTSTNSTIGSSRSVDELDSDSDSDLLSIPDTPYRPFVGLQRETTSSPLSNLGALDRLELLNRKTTTPTVSPGPSKKKVL